MSQSANNVLKAAARAHCDGQTFPPADTNPHVRTRCYDEELERLRRQSNTTVAQAPVASKKAGTFFMIFVGIAVVILIGYTMMSSSKKSGKNNLKIGNRTNASKLNLKNK